MTKIMVTGATGFMGKHVINELAKYKNVKIIPVVRKKNNFLKHKSIKKIILTNNLFNKDKKWWEKKCKGVDIIIHLAWYVDPKKYLHSKKNLDCLIGSISLASGAASANVKKFVGIGTCLEYKNVKKKLSIFTKIDPIFPYAIAKASLFFHLSFFFRYTKIKFNWCRVFHLYGEGERKNRLIPHVHSRLSKGKKIIIKNSNFTYDFMDVKDAAKKIIKISLSNKSGHFNICTGKGRSVREIVSEIAKQYKKKNLIVYKNKKPTFFDRPYIVGSYKNNI